MTQRCELSDLIPEHEVWRPIPGYEGRYEVSSHGRVWSHISRRELNYRSKHSRNHLRVVLYDKDAEPKTWSTHVLVALTFIGPRPEGQEVRHLNGDPIDNRLANLAYGTRSDQRLDDVANGVNPYSRRTECKWGHEYTPETTDWRMGRKGRPYRSCLTCRRERRTRRAL